MFSNWELLNGKNPSKIEFLDINAVGLFLFNGERISTFFKKLFGRKFMEAVGLPRRTAKARDVLAPRTHFLTCLLLYSDINICIKFDLIFA